MESFQYVVIGGGVIGLSTAYHLAKLGAQEILLLEQNELASGTSWHAAGIVGPLRATMNLTILAKYALTLIPELEQETGQYTGYRRTGGFWLAEDAQRLIELKRIKAMGDMNGLNARLVSRDEVKAKLPILNVSDLVGALWVEEDGQVNPYDLCMAYAKGARMRGVQIREHARVEGFGLVNGAVQEVHLAGGERIRCTAVINCAGLWAHQVGQLAGVSIPVQAVEHMYAVTEPLNDLPRPCPFARDMKNALYIKEDAGRLVIGTFEANAVLWDWRSVPVERSFIELPENWDHLEPMLEAAQHRIPCLAQTGLQHFMNGPESFTPDTKQVMGEAPGVKNYYVAAGMNSLGIMSSAGVGKAMAEWMVMRKPPVDLWEVDIARFAPVYSRPEFLYSRTQEAVANQMAMHWPFKQFKTGRNLFKSALYPVYKDLGAVFGTSAGWERPLWFASNAAESELLNSYADQNWWPWAEREARDLQTNVSLLELSPFTKILIEGRDATAFLQRLTTADIDVSLGRVVYTLMLNPAGGIESELTVTRLNEHTYLMVSAAATRCRDMAWLSRHVASDEAVTLTDSTQEQAVFGVMGPRARELLQELTSARLDQDSFPFATSQSIEIDAHPVRASRVSFVGELGWEIYVDRNSAQDVFQAVAAAGQRYGLGHAGLFCMESCRLEKGFHHWGQDMGPDDTPIEAGLRFAVNFDKAGSFVGREALLRQMEDGTGRCLLLFQVHADSPLLLHDEPVFREGQCVGRSTSGGLGFRTGLSLSFGMVEFPAGASGELRTAHYEIELAGDRYPMTVLARAPYDPKGRRMRA